VVSPAARPPRSARREREHWTSDEAAAAGVPLAASPSASGRISRPLRDGRRVPARAGSARGRGGRGGRCISGSFLTPRVSGRGRRGTAPATTRPRFYRARAIGRSRRTPLRRDGRRLAAGRACRHRRPDAVPRRRHLAPTTRPAHGALATGRQPGIRFGPAADPFRRRPRARARRAGTAAAAPPGPERVVDPAGFPRRPAAGPSRPRA
jgi:hypothetical protein